MTLWWIKQLLLKFGSLASSYLESVKNERAKEKKWKLLSKDGFISFFFVRRVLFLFKTQRKWKIEPNETIEGVVILCTDPTRQTSEISRRELLTFEDFHLMTFGCIHGGTNRIQAEKTCTKPLLSSFHGMLLLLFLSSETLRTALIAYLVPVQGYLWGA